VAGDVGRGELVGRQREHSRHAERHVAVADHHGAGTREVELEIAVVGVAVVPGDELRP
jgi:hypothetical protein